MTDVSNPRCFVVLHHTGVAPEHFDLMIDNGHGALTTFRLTRWPTQAGDSVEPIADHRTAYLTYEGEVSGGRGQVLRVDAGNAIHDASAQCFTLHSLSGVYNLRNNKQRWVME